MAFDWLKPIVNAVVTGAIAGLSTWIINGQVDPNVSIMAVIATGALAFLIEYQKYLQEQNITTAGNVKKGSKILLF